ncbi:hypothetical protein EDC56_3120 [Sinobacterium caligoides]|uniref:Uncharacterized protein n=1 Tax=Sinobacterium caligoides TaxID=933926 RepID=A0A3N2DGF8_9GAMM|nr:hypothetical protein [Sinobacterium caligoides]ROR98883.1 hypothetical protein EDC56_3120 [Sinobacterium caligoides]
MIPKMHIVRNNASRRRDARRRALLHLHLNNTSHLEEQLQREIEQLDGKLETLKTASNRIDFGLVQTYTEMLHSRRQLFRDINRTPSKLW